MAKYPIRIDDDARFVRLIGWLFFAVTISAFVRSYFAPLSRGEFISANFWMHPHALVSFAFAGLFIAQPWMVLKRNMRWHRIIGWTLGALVLGAVVTGVAVQFAMWPTVPEDENNLVPAAFRLFQLLPCLAGFFVLGIILRRRSDWHWRLMVHSALAPVGTSIGRFTRMWPDGPIPPGPMINLILVSFVVCLLVSDKIRYGKTHLANWLGLIVFVVTVPLSLTVASSDWYAELTLGPNAE